MASASPMAGLYLATMCKELATTCFVWRISGADRACLLFAKRRRFLCCRVHGGMHLSHLRGERRIHVLLSSMGPNTRADLRTGIRRLPVFSHTP